MLSQCGKLGLYLVSVADFEKRVIVFIEESGVGALFDEDAVKHNERINRGVAWNVESICRIKKKRYESEADNNGMRIQSNGV